MSDKTNKNRDPFGCAVVSLGCLIPLALVGLAGVAVVWRIIRWGFGGTP